MAAGSKSPSGKRIADLIILLALAGFAIVYCVDAVRASATILNLILVLPLTIIVLVLCLVQFVLDFLRHEPKPVAESAASGYGEALPDEPFADVLPVAGLFGAYVLTLPWLGFDAGTALFVGAFLWWHGERRYPWLVGYAIGFAFLLAFFFSRMLPYPMPMLILGVD